MSVEIDFKLYQNKEQEKGFQFKDDDDLFYDLTGYTVNLNLYKDGPDSSPIVINGTIELSTSSATFVFTASHTDTLGYYEYVIVGIKDGQETLLLKGNIEVEAYAPFSQSIDAFLQSELPEGLTLTNNFINQKTQFWRLFLQDAFDISDNNLNKDSAWPILVNALIAKLIAYDALMVALRGNILAIAQGATSTKGGGIKSIETGPSKVEFLPAGEVITNLLKASAQGKDGLMKDLSVVLCGLSNKLEVKLPMCKQLNVPINFSVYKDVSWEKVTLSQVLEEPVVSVG